MTDDPSPQPPDSIETSAVLPASVRETAPESFSLAADFQAARGGSALGLGVLEGRYQDVFSEALKDGVITVEERAELDDIAATFGLDASRLHRLEDAMTAAYEAHHRVRIQSMRPMSLRPTLSEDIVPPSSLRGDVLGSDAQAELEGLREENQLLRERISLLEQELERAQAAVNVEVDLSDITAVTSVSGSDDAWRRVERDPFDPNSYALLYAAYGQAGEFDGLVVTAQALVAIGHADENMRAFAEQYRPKGLVSPHAAIDESLWQSCLFHPDEDPITGAIFAAIAPAVLIGRATQLRRDGLLRIPVEGSRVDPAASTVMAVRAVSWAAAMLGLPVPRIHVERDEPGAYVHVTGVPPASIVGRGALSGRAAPELAFLAGRHLAGYRAENFVKTMFSGTQDLEDLFLAALLIANPALPVTSTVRARAEALARAVEPVLEAKTHDALRGHYLRFAEAGGRTNLQRWSQAVDKTAVRAGLALGQDVESALRLLEAEEGPGGPLARDLLAFGTSERYLRLRKALGIAITG